MRLELRHDEQQHRRHDQDDQRHDRDRVGHGRLDLLTQVDLALEHVRQAEQHVVQHAARLTGLDHRDVEVVERLRVLRHGGREARALLDVVAHQRQRLGELLVADLLGQDRQRAQDRQPGVHHGGELPREDRDLLELDLRGPDVDLEVEALLLLADLERDVSHLAEALEDQALVVRDQRAGDEVPGLVPNLVLVGIRHSRLPTSCRPWPWLPRRPCRWVRNRAADEALELLGVVAPLERHRPG